MDGIHVERGGIGPLLGVGLLPGIHGGRRAGTHGVRVGVRLAEGLDVQRDEDVVVGDSDVVVLVPVDEFSSSGNHGFDAPGRILDAGRLTAGGLRRRSLTAAAAAATVAAADLLLHVPSRVGRRLMNVHPHLVEYGEESNLGPGGAERRRNTLGVVVRIDADLEAIPRHGPGGADARRTDGGGDQIDPTDVGAVGYRDPSAAPGLGRSGGVPVVGHQRDRDHT
mmetsp:Transcript_22001/g.65121  ORF Transcript_22001/g.65121 Transcript_22001/m.65121 type:complete len:223 (-) Transcript_22001:3669-4337(-)